MYLTNIIFSILSDFRNSKKIHFTKIHDGHDFLKCFKMSFSEKLSGYMERRDFPSIFPVDCYEYLIWFYCHFATNATLLEHETERYILPGLFTDRVIAFIWFLTNRLVDLLVVLRLLLRTRIGVIWVLTTRWAWWVPRCHTSGVRCSPKSSAQSVSSKWNIANTN